MEAKHLRTLQYCTKHNLETAWRGHLTQGYTRSSSANCQFMPSRGVILLLFLGRALHLSVTKLVRVNIRSSRIITRAHVPTFNFHIIGYCLLGLSLLMNTCFIDHNPISCFAAPVHCVLRRILDNLLIFADGKLTEANLPESSN